MDVPLGHAERHGDDRRRSVRIGGKGHGKLVNAVSPAFDLCHSMPWTFCRLDRNRPDDGA